jgi:hypothetical protein
MFAQSIYFGIPEQARCNSTEYADRSCRDPVVSRALPAVGKSISVSPHTDPENLKQWALRSMPAKTYGVGQILQIITYHAILAKTGLCGQNFIAYVKFN